MNMTCEIVIILTYTEMGILPLLVGNSFDIFSKKKKKKEIADSILVLQNMDFFYAYDYFCIFKYLL